MPKCSEPDGHDMKIIYMNLDYPPEQIPENLRILVARASVFVICPNQAVTYKFDSEGEFDFSDDSKRHFLFGKANHRFKEWVNKQSPDTIEAEKKKWIVFKQNGKLAWALSGTKDAWKIDQRGQYILDYKGILLDNGKLTSFYRKMKDFPDLKVIKQISIYNYMEYVISGNDVKRGVIGYFDKLNPRNYFQGECDLLPLDVTEKFIFEHPLFAPENLERATMAYKAENAWNCDPKYCQLMREGQCRFVSRLETAPESKAVTKARAASKKAKAKKAGNDILDAMDALVPGTKAEVETKEGE